LGCQVRWTVKPDQLPISLPASFGNLAQAIHMPLHEVPAKPVAEAQGALQVDEGAGYQLAKVGAAKGLGPGLKTTLVGTLLHDRQACPVDCDALSHCKL